MQAFFVQGLFVQRLFVPRVLRIISGIIKFSTYNMRLNKDYKLKKLARARERGRERDDANSKSIFLHQSGVKLSTES